MNIGIDLGGSHIAIGLIERGKIVCKRERDFSDEDRKDIEKVIENSIRNLIEEILEEKELKIEEINKIGISAPGTIKNGIIIKAENLGIINFDIINVIKRNFNIEKVIVNNDAKCAAVCEKEIGSLKPYDDAVFICLGTGIGGAVFINRKIIEVKTIFWI